MLYIGEKAKYSVHSYLSKRINGASHAFITWIIKQANPFVIDTRNNLHANQIPSYLSLFPISEKSESYTQEIFIRIHFKNPKNVFLNFEKHVRKQQRKPVVTTSNSPIHVHTVYLAVTSELFVQQPEFLLPL